MTETPNLNKALSQLQGELPQIKRTKTAEVKDQAGRVLYTYNYADLGDVVADVGPLLAKYGLAFYCAPTINPADRREMIMPWALLHESGEEKAGEWPLGPVGQKPQTLGSAITYGRRYCFTAATNIVLEDDDDGQRAQQDHGTRQSAGDAWESATPARPARQQDQPADGGPSFYRRKLAEAEHVRTDAAVDRLTREAADGAKKGLCTPAQATHIQNQAELILRKLKLDATPVDVEDLARQAAAGEPEPDPAPADPPGSDRHRKLVGAVRAHFKRLGFTDDDDAQRLEHTATLAGTSGIGSTNDLDEDELKAVADTLARCRNIEALKKALTDAAAQAGDGDA
jgi:ERF superfamily